MDIGFGGQPSLFGFQVGQTVQLHSGWPASRSFLLSRQGKPKSEGWWRRRESNPRPRIFP